MIDDSNQNDLLIFSDKFEWIYGFTLTPEGFVITKLEDEIDQNFLAIINPYLSTMNTYPIRSNFYKFTATHCIESNSLFNSSLPLLKELCIWKTDNNEVYVVFKNEAYPYRRRYLSKRG